MSTLQPLQIVFLNDTAYVNGGAAKVAIMEANGLAERGHHVTFIACDDGGPNRTRALHPDVRLHCTGQKEILNSNPLTAAVQGIRNGKAIKLIDEVLGQCDPAVTIVHLHAWSKALSAAIAPAIIEHRQPFICTLHDYFCVCPNGTLYNHVSGQVCELQPMSAACIKCNCDSRAYAHKLWRVTRCYTQQHWYHMPRGVPHLLAPSRFAQRVLQKYLPPECVVDVLGNPIDCRHEPPVDVVSNSRILYVGRLAPEKGIQQFLQACRLAGVRPTLAGDGPDAARLKQAFPEAEYLGWLSSDETRKVQRSARAIVFPSLLYECDPLVIKEAAHMGIPVIAAAQSAASDTVRHEQTGLLFLAGKTELLASAIKRLTQDGKLASRLGKNAYDAFWEAPFTIERHIEELEDYYAGAQEAGAARLHVPATNAGREVPR